MVASSFEFVTKTLKKVVPLEINGGPIFVFELTMSFWLLLKRLQSSGMAELDNASVKN